MTAPLATPGTDRPESVPELLVEQFLTRSQQAPGRVVIRQRTADLWHELTAGEVAQAISRVSHALGGAGVAAHDYVLLVGAASAEWLVAELACQAIGASSVVVADDAASGTLPAEVTGKVRAIALVDSDRRLRARRRDAVTSVPGLSGLPIVTVADSMEGEETLPGPQAPLGADVACTVICSTQTGTPVYTAITYADIDAAWRGLLAELGCSPRDRLTPPTPAHYWVGRVLMLQLFAAAGVTFYFTPEGIADSQALREIRPTIWWATPQAWLGLVAPVRVQMLGSGRISRFAYGQSQPGRAKEARPALSAIRRWLVMKPLLAQLGLASVRIGLVVGGSAPGLVAQTLHHWGLDFTELEFRTGAVGPAGSAPATETGSNQPGETAETGGLDWETGIETRVRQSDYVAEAVAVHGTGGEVRILLEPQLDCLISWASSNGVSFPSVAALLEQADVGRLLAREVARHVGGAAGTATVRRIDVIPDFAALQTHEECLYTESGTLRAGAVRRLVTAGETIPRMRTIPADVVVRAETGV
jgi:hypothetical protein